MDDEEWRDVVDYEGLYMVSDHGRVKSLPKRTSHRGEHIMNTPVGSGGYLYVHLRKDGRNTQKLVHRLVADAFIANEYDKPQVNHIDGNKRNNSVENLEWSTPSENQLHAYRVLNRVRKTDHSPRPTKRKLTKEQVMEIRSSHESQSSLARKYGVGQHTIWCILKRKTYKEI